MHRTIPYGDGSVGDSDEHAPMRLAVQIPERPITEEDWDEDLIN